MKRILQTITFCLMGYLTAYAAPAEKDSIIVTFGDKSRLIIYSDDRKELEALMKYDLNSLLRDLGARLDTINGETKVYIDELDGGKYLRDTSRIDKDKNYVRINLKGIRIKDGETEVSITTRGVDIKDGQDRVRIGRKDDSYDNDTTDAKGRDYDDDRVSKIRRVHKASSPRQGFSASLGLNAYAQNIARGNLIENYDLRPFGSRYISLEYVKGAALVRGPKAGLYLDFGLNVAWNNLMFEGNNTVMKQDEILDFPVIVNGLGKEAEVRKSKITIPYLNFSLMPTLSFRDTFISYISAGGYVGYRLGGYTKIKYENGKKDRERGDFYLNDIRYGAAFELGFRNFPDFFVHYDRNELFQSGRGPQIRMINFGIRL
jgi:hypothetical protein